MIIAYFMIQCLPFQIDSFQLLIIIICMSEIDFTDSIFQRELVNSQSQPSVANEDKDIMFNCFAKEHSFPQQSIPLHKITYSNKNRLSQTGASRRPPPISVSKQMPLRYSYSPSGTINQSRFSEKFKDKTQSTLIDIKDSDLFECKTCVFNPNPKCQICKGKKSIGGDNSLIKFFQYVIAFKMGAKQSYKGKRLNNFSKNLGSAVNNFCSDFYNDKNHQEIRNSCAPELGRLSVGQPKKYDKHDIADELNTMITVHQSYVCDGCQKTPIIGIRFHCLQCVDYDECEDCHIKLNHSHKMQKIQKCGKGKQLQSMVNLLAIPLSNNSKLSLRPPPSIKRGADSGMVTRSALH